MNENNQLSLTKDFILTIVSESIIMYVGIEPYKRVTTFRIILDIVTVVVVQYRVLLTITYHNSTLIVSECCLIC
jgi:hypothetical protein